MVYAFSYSTPLGDIVIVENGSSIVRISFGNCIPRDADHSETPLLKKAYIQIYEYLEGNRREFTFPTETSGTSFQMSVWDALKRIPYGETRSYKEIAIRIGNANASRAVGMACNKNPLPIVVPCHRVIGSNGKSTGYAGGVEIKEALLSLEGSIY